MSNELKNIEKLFNKVKNAKLNSAIESIVATEVDKMAWRLVKSYIKENKESIEKEIKILIKTSLDTELPKMTTDYVKAIEIFNPN